jgi:4-hydroxythreonine-4-phosphate dehydrogenase
MGDAAGIGAEIILKALADRKINSFCVPVIIGDESFLRKTARDLELDFDFIAANDNFSQNSRQTQIYNLNNLSGETITAGEESAVTGKSLRRIYRKGGRFVAREKN